ncbi:glutamate-cysteine ligase family protein [Streptococcus sp. DD12]|uniref:glutamate-cysteine ligase family protein n=1 Tax=Streptococcus sp. DD12 TaxID=1777880 RepID=UPI0007921032|nr:glutamate-cysteine ligase family protein [Streptococcus sp. DD12]KXT75375.1 hypothetical protein STRDD12_01496 [Streptococcus sp. DD12]
MGKTSKQLLEERYLNPLKERPLLLGVEFEFPIINQTHPESEQGLDQCCLLLERLSQDGNYVVLKRDTDGQAIELSHQKSGDHLLFEVAYTTLEIAFAPAKDLTTLVKRFEGYLHQLNAILAEWGLTIGGFGLHPAWEKTKNYMVKTDRYEMLTQFLALSQDYQEKTAHQLHPYPSYGGFIMGNQVQFDVSKENLLSVLNLFNQIEPAKAYLFANSAFAPWEDTRISRDRFWEASMHGIYAENIGVFPRDFSSLSEWLDYVNQSAMFYVKRGEETIYFEPYRLPDFFSAASIQGWNLQGQRRQFSPKESDISFHRAYHYQDVTARGTVELRSVCTQPLELTWAPIAFELGLRANLEKWEALMANHVFFSLYGRDYPELRRRFSAPHLSKEEEEAIRQLSGELLVCAREGLGERGHGEEVFLKPIEDFLAEN